MFLIVNQNKPAQGNDGCKILYLGVTTLWLNVPSPYHTMPKVSTIWYVPPGQTKSLTYMSMM